MKDMRTLSAAPGDVSAARHRCFGRILGQQRGLLLVTLGMVFGLSPVGQAVLPSRSPDGGYPHSNTAEGDNALFSLTTGYFNTATGFEALYNNTTGNFNTATGYKALFSNTSGGFNTAIGLGALFSNTTGDANTAIGLHALYSNTTGIDNTAIGANALGNNTTGHNNIAVGASAGANLIATGSNIDIGDPGVAGEANTIRIGNARTHTAAYIAGINGVEVTGAAVVVNNSSQLGVAPSSEQFKEGVKPMDYRSEAILALQPVTFRYKRELDAQGVPQFGLLAEQVENINPDLVARDEKGQVFSVRYEAVNAMLLNEFLKEHRKVEEHERTIAQLESTLAKQHLKAAQEKNEIQSLTRSLNERASQIQKITAQLELSRPAAQTDADNQ